MNRILIDGANLSLQGGTGIATYARNLVKTCNNLGMEPHVLYGENFSAHKKALFREISFFDVNRNESFRKKTAGLAANFLTGFPHAMPFKIPLSESIVKDAVKNRLPATENFWNSRLVYEFAGQFFRSTGLFRSVSNKMEASVAHWTYALPLFLRGAKNVYTIHDLVPLRLPYTTLDDKRVYHKLISKIIKRADRIITVSESSKKDIRQLFDISDEKVINTYQAVDIPQSYLRTSDKVVTDALAGTYGLKFKEYLLFYGAIEPKKNVGRLIEAYLSSNLEIPLVIAGKDGWLFNDELRHIDFPSLKYLRNDGSVTREERRIIRIGYSSFPQLVNLIRGARAVTFPSIYEGFGIPIVEGMICGTPVMTSNYGATREIADEAAILVDPFDIRDMAQALTRIESDDSWVRSYVKKGSLRATAFSRDAIAPNLERVYAGMLKEGR